MYQSPRREPRQPPEPKRPPPFKFEKAFFVAAIPVAMLLVYLAVVAPQRVPIPPDVNVPFPVLTRSLEIVILWCAERPAIVAAIGLGVLVPGLLMRISGKRYFTTLAVISSLALVLSYLSISAPIDRLLHNVEAQLDVERPMPDTVKGNATDD